MFIRRAYWRAALDGFTGDGSDQDAGVDRADDPDRVILF